VFGAGAKSDELNELLIRLEDYLSIKSGIG
jgi:hypothetical protein